MFVFYNDLFIYFSEAIQMIHYKYQSNIFHIISKSYKYNVNIAFDYNLNGIHISQQSI